MGVSLSSLLEATPVQIDELRNKVILIDAMNMLYQFITTIRQYDGTPLKDSNGQVTSHLTGLFSRCTKLMMKGIKLAFVFDGTMPELKRQERARREALKTEAISSLKEATDANDVEGMKKYAGRSARITSEMITESQELLEALGIPYIQAPSEGEAQAAHMVRRGDGDFVGSQDFDCLLYAAPSIIRNLSLSMRRKKINAVTYKTILPEILDLDKTLQHLSLSLEQLRVVGMLVGTDFCVGGVKGLGPKKSVKLVKEYGHDFDSLFKHVQWQNHQDTHWEKIYELIGNIPVTNDYKLQWGAINTSQVVQILVTKHDFSEERVTATLEDIDKESKKAKQVGLDSFL